MLQHTDSVDPVVREFLSDLRTAVKHAVTFEGTTAVLTSVVSMAENDIAQFREPMAAVEMIASRTHSDHISVISAARELVKVRTAAVRELIGRSAKAVEHEVADVQTLRLAQVKRQRESEHRQSLISSRMTEIEVKGMVHRADQELFDRLRKSYNRFTPQNESVARSRELKHFLVGMKDQSERQLAMFQLMRRRALDAAEEVEEMKGMRVRCEREQAQFWRATKMVSAIPASELAQRKQCQHPTAAEDKSESDASTHTEASISELMTKLESIQMEHDKTLESLSLFLDHVKREVPKRREHRRHRP
jgi:hypothetical protein